MRLNDPIGPHEVEVEDENNRQLKTSSLRLLLGGGEPGRGAPAPPVAYAAAYPRSEPAVERIFYTAAPSPHFYRHRGLQLQARNASVILYDVVRLSAAVGRCDLVNGLPRRSYCAHSLAPSRV